MGTNNEFPVSSAARQFYAIKSFMMYILMAAYLASFTAQLSSAASLAPQTITTFDSFWQKDVPACIANNSVTVRSNESLVRARSLSRARSLRASSLRARSHALLLAHPWTNKPLRIVP